MKKLSFLLFGIVLLFGCKISNLDNSNVSILSVSPNSTIISDTTTEFTIEIEYSYHGISKPVLDIFYTNDSITYEPFIDTAVTLSPGEGQKTFIVNVTPHNNGVNSSAGFLVSLDSNPDGMFNNQLARDFKHITFN